MRGINLLILTGAVAVSVFLTASRAIAQDDQSTGGQSPRNGQGGRRQRQSNFDPAQYRQRSMERYRERLEVTDDAEWKALEPLIEKVLDARTALRAAGRGVSVGGNRSGGGADRSATAQGRNPAVANPAAESLQRALDAKAPSSEIKAALAKFLEYRKAKEGDLARAQDALRTVLTSRQEAFAVLSGLL